MSDNNLRHIQAPPAGVERPTHKELAAAIDQEIAAGKEASRQQNREAKPINEDLSDAEAAREQLKQRIKTIYGQATRDLDYAETAIAAIDKEIAMQQLNREGLVEMRDEAKSRITQCKYGLTRFA